MEFFTCIITPGVLLAGSTKQSCVCATWKAALWLPLIDRDSSNLCRSPPVHCQPHHQPLNNTSILLWVCHCSPSFLSSQQLYFVSLFFLSSLILDNSLPLATQFSCVHVCIQNRQEMSPSEAGSDLLRALLTSRGLREQIPLLLCWNQWNNLKWTERKSQQCLCNFSCIAPACLHMLLFPLRAV